MVVLDCNNLSSLLCTVTGSLVSMSVLLVLETGIKMAEIPSGRSLRYTAAVVDGSSFGRGVERITSDARTAQLPWSTMAPTG